VPRSHEDCAAGVLRGAGMQMSSGAIKLAAIGAAAVLALFLLFGLIVISWATNTTGAAATASAALNTSKVPAQYVAWIEEAGTECSAVSPPQIAAQLYQESRLNDEGTNNDVVSPAGAEGIAQFMPGTWATYGQADAPGPVSPFNVGDAIMAMGRFDCALASMLAGVPGTPMSNMLAGYNAGPQAVLDADGVPPIAQTQQYVADIEALIPQFSAPGISLDASGFAQAEINAAERWLGTPYVWGGGDPSGPTLGVPNSQNPGVPGFDCSGLVLYAVYQASGGKILLPHLANDQAAMGVAVPPSQLQPGDVIALQLDGPGVYSHIVIYIGGGMVIQAPTFGQDVDEVPLSSFAGAPEAIRWFGGPGGTVS
jgi:hypothetical protein